MSTTQVTTASIISQVQDELSEELSASGKATCPCCLQRTQVYRRTLTTTMLQALHVLTQHSTYWFHLETLLKNNVGLSSAVRGDAAKLRHWGLLELDPKRFGYYRTTEKALAFLRGDLAVPRAVYLYRGDVVEEHPTFWTIEDFEQRKQEPMFQADEDDAGKEVGFLTVLKKSLRSLFVTK
jgi:hypothetical protein